MCLYFLIFLSRSLLSMLSVPLFKRNFYPYKLGEYCAHLINSDIAASEINASS